MRTADPGPQRATGDYARVARAIRFLDGAADTPPDLAAVAGAMGLSPHHAQRVFSRWAGVSPKRFVQAVRATRARAALAHAPSVLDAAFDAGLSGPGRLHDLTVSILAMTPGEIRRGGAGLTVAWGVHPSPFGPLEIGMTDRGVCSLHFRDTPGDEAQGCADWPQARWVRSDAATAAVAARVCAPLDDAAHAAPLPVLVRGTNLQVQVWRALLRIPAGRVTSYGALAGAVGRPTAARAVAGAVAANRLALLIPCHRVLRATGALGGYRWGTERKRAMLAREAARAADGA